MLSSALTLIHSVEVSVVNCKLVYSLRQKTQEWNPGDFSVASKRLELVVALAEEH